MQHVGVSPNDIPNSIEEWLKQKEDLKRMLKNEKVVAVGEIGLDYYWNDENKDLQKQIFIDQIEIANEYNLPIVIHTREAIMDTIDILKNKTDVKKKGVFHCCPQNRELIKEALKLGFYISFAGPITFKSSKNAEEIVNMVPIDRLLIETDSPYLAMTREERNEPANVALAVEKLAELHECDVSDVDQQTEKNARYVFDL